MIAGRIGCELALVAVVCVLTIFLFPAVQGPYSVVNGPVTALQAIRTAARMRKLIMQAAFRFLRNGLISPLAFLGWMSLPQTGFHLVALPECNAILRC
jgi:membrane-associated protease RseP (regulator of RpoE activity)